ncbi:MAG TPA: hypothetical protein VKQ32_20005, partial [Polyangia bacterium]|nr:hypothetical protein [Polyangia bacterium]
MACAILAAGLLPACSGGATQTSSVEIVHWWKQGGEAQAIAALLAEFEKENPTVKIIDGSVEGGSVEARNVIRSRMSEGIPPDTFQANGGWDLMAWVLYNGVNAQQTKMQTIDDFAQDWIGHVPEGVRNSVSYAITPDEVHVYA